MTGLLEGLRTLDRQAKAAMLVLILVTASVAGLLSYSILDQGAPTPERTVGDLTVTGSIARDGVDPDEYGGVATLTYTGGGSDIEWRIMDAEDTAFIRDFNGTYSERGYVTASNGRTLTIDEPGRYAVRMYVDGALARSGTAVLDGAVDRSFAWTQALPSGESYDYDVTFRYMFSDYLTYADDPAVRYSNQQSDARFVLVDDTLEAMERALRAEYVEVRGSSAILGGQDYADYLLSFVQCCIAYPDMIAETGGSYVLDVDSGSGDMFLEGEVERWAYPLETLHKGYGDCEDTSFLAAALFSAAGYAAALAVLPDHMVAAVVLDDFTPVGSVHKLELADKRVVSTGENIYFCETTFDSAVPCGYVTAGVHEQISSIDAVTMVTA